MAAGVDANSSHRRFDEQPQRPATSRPSQREAVLDEDEPLGALEPVGRRVRRLMDREMTNAVLACRMHDQPASVPFVEGTRPAWRGSTSTALRSARASPLKQVSAMWWLFSP